ncbi:MAG TPA: hypothetical protein VK186_01725, partial [Candidatus Deferrimicrobium sp.]|nr:hypothetical protein [Candidatus Deferrimicrobium sp.]
KVAALQDNTFYVGLIHAGNTSPKRTVCSRWLHHPVDEIRGLLALDWVFYKPGFSATPDLIAGPQVTANEHRVEEKPTGSIRNIFACLVHENIECVVDLVRNLSYQDPSSQILLYNGGKDSALLNNFPTVRWCIRRRGQ